MVRSILSGATPRRTRFSIVLFARSDLIAFLISFASASISSGMVFILLRLSASNLSCKLILSNLERAMICPESATATVLSLTGIGRDNRKIHRSFSGGGYEKFLGNRNSRRRRDGALFERAGRVGSVSRRDRRAKSGRRRGVHPGDDPTGRGRGSYRDRAAVLPPRRRTEDTGGNRRLQKYPARYQRAQRHQRHGQFSQGLRQRRHVAIGRRRILHGRAHRLSRGGGNQLLQGGGGFLRWRHLSTMGRPAGAGYACCQCLLSDPGPLR